MDTVITRSRWIVGILVGALCICGVRLVQLQIIEGPSLAAQGPVSYTHLTLPTIRLV